MAWAPLPSSIGRGLNLQPSDCEPSTLQLDQGCRGAPLKSHSGPIFFLNILGPKLMCFNTFKGYYYQRNKQK